jgi:hypothetical protein
LESLNVKGRFDEGPVVEGKDFIEGRDSSIGTSKSSWLATPSSPVVVRLAKKSKIKKVDVNQLPFSSETVEKARDNFGELSSSAGLEIFVGDCC